MGKAFRKNSPVSDQLEPLERRSSRSRRRLDDISTKFRRPDNQDVTVGPLRIVDRQKKVFINGVEKSLTPMEYRLLGLLAASPGQVLSNDVLARGLEQRGASPDPDDVKKIVYRLRRKLEPEPSAPRWIQNAKGRGYRLVLRDDDVD